MKNTDNDSNTEIKIEDALAFELGIKPGDNKEEIKEEIGEVPEWNTEDANDEKNKLKADGDNGWGFQLNQDREHLLSNLDQEELDKIRQKTKMEEDKQIILNEPNWKMGEKVW